MAVPLDSSLLLAGYLRGPRGRVRYIYGLEPIARDIAEAGVHVYWTERPCRIPAWFDRPHRAILLSPSVFLALPWVVRDCLSHELGHMLAGPEDCVRYWQSCRYRDLIEPVWGVAPATGWGMSRSMDAWRAAMLAHSRLSSHRRLVERTRTAIAEALDIPGRWYVSFSGGKDSTTLLHLVLGVAGSIDAVHVEDEIIAPGTHDYVESVGAWPGVTLIRTAAPIRHSREHTSWGETPWLRELPQDALWFPTRAEHLRWYNEHYVGGFVGTRREESSVREISARVNGTLYRSTTRGWWVSTTLHRWTLTDVWSYLIGHDVPHHPGYDVMTAAGIPHDRQRIGPPANVRALRWSSMAWLRIGWPGYYDEVCRRYPHLRSFA